MMDYIKQCLQALPHRKCLQACILLMAAWLVPYELFAVDGLQLNAVHLIANKQTKVAIQLNNEASYTAFQVDIHLPQGVELVVTDGEYDVTLSERATNTHGLTISSVDEGVFRLVVHSSLNKPFSGHSGNLFFLTLRATEDFVGPATIRLTNVILTTTSIHELKAQDVSAICDVLDYLPGDVNRDGSVTIADVTALVNIILGKDNTVPYLYDHAAADVNGDNYVTIADVTALVNIILGKN